MKNTKIITKIFFTTLMGCLLLLSGCGKNEAETNTAIKGSDTNTTDKEAGITEVTAKEKILSVDKAYLTTKDNKTIINEGDEYDIGAFAMFERDDADEQKTVEINDTEIEGFYCGSYEDVGINYKVDLYSDENENIFQLSEKDGSLVGYIDVDKLDKSISFDSEQTLLGALQEFVSEYIDTNEFASYINTQVLKYDGESETSRNEEGYYEPEDNEETSYVVTYFYEIDGLKTSEKFEITVHNNKIESFFYTMPGEFSQSMDKLIVNTDGIDSKVEELLDNNGFDDRENSQYEITESYISIDNDNNYYIVAFIYLTYQENGNTVEGKQEIVISLK
jgi:hypothetical protein